MFHSLPEICIHIYMVYYCTVSHLHYEATDRQYQKDEQMAQCESFQEQLWPVKLGGCLSWNKSKDLFQC
jgi:hypothetical protein